MTTELNITDIECIKFITNVFSSLEIINAELHIMNNDVAESIVNRLPEEVAKGFENAFVDLVTNINASTTAFGKMTQILKDYIYKDDTHLN